MEHDSIDLRSDHALRNESQTPAELCRLRRDAGAEW